MYVKIKTIKPSKYSSLSILKGNVIDGIHPAFRYPYYREMYIPEDRNEFYSKHCFIL